MESTLAHRPASPLFAREWPYDQVREAAVRRRYRPISAVRISRKLSFIANRALALLTSTGLQLRDGRLRFGEKVRAMLGVRELQGF